MGSFMNSFLAFPHIDSVAFSLGSLSIHWYAISYVAGIALGWVYLRYFVRTHALLHIKEKTIDDLITWAIIGILLGGRLGYILFYNPFYYWQNPLTIFMTWQGGMSFHGGVLGVILAFWFYSKKKRVSFLTLLDLGALAAPLGIFLGRIANFINGELYGRITNVSWSILFPHGGYLPRHPSQIYEACGEGLVLLILLNVLAWKSSLIYKPGKLAGIGMIAYAIMRSFLELFREPDAGSGYYWAHFTKGQLLSIPLLLIGLYLLFRNNDSRRPPQTKD